MIPLQSGGGSSINQGGSRLENANRDDQSPENKSREDKNREDNGQEDQSREGPAEKTRA